ncbi:MAG: alpha/beta hydrolase [Chloroflexi bacterium]|nr:alpha/beta hydrolase [Chloroflexota bacterium]
MAQAGDKQESNESAQPRGRRIFMGLVAAIALLLLVGATYQALASAADRRNHPPPGEMIDIGGFEMHLYCTGEGSPTVILITGASNNHAVWDPVQRAIETETRVCSFDRAGLGWSDFDPSAETMDDHVENLEALLQAAGESGPYIMVGHSIGGRQARAFTARNRDDVVGVVLVDSTIEGQNNRFPAEIAEGGAGAVAFFGVCRALAPFGVIRLLNLGGAQAESFETLSQEAKDQTRVIFHRTPICRGLQADAAAAETITDASDIQPHNLGDVPLIVLAAGLSPDEEAPGAFPDDMIPVFEEFKLISAELQRELASLSTDSQLIVAEESGHYIQTTQPDLVVSAIETLIASYATD